MMLRPRGAGLLSILLSIFVFQVVMVDIAHHEATASDFLLYPADGTLRRIRAPILMYHYVSPLPDDADSIRVDLTVSPALFREHMEFLHGAGYETISLYELYNALVAGASLPPKPVILTFDDGYIDHYQYVFPILQEFGFAGTFFIITDTADHNAPGHLNWTQIAEMAKAGMSMESHAKVHLDLRSRDWDFLVHQVVGSLESLQAHTGESASMFCYPAGHYDQITLEMLGKLPVSLAVTTQHGAMHTTSGRLELARLRIGNSTGVTGLGNLLESNR